MQISGSGAPVSATLTLKGPKAVATAGALLTPKVDKNAVKSGAAKALASSSMTGASWAKSQARAKVQQIVERLKVLRKLFAYDPKKMAQALAQVFKELKAAVKAYGKAGGDELSVAGEAAGAAVGSGGSAAAGGEETSPDSPEAEAKPVQAAPSGDHALYDAVVGDVRKSIGEDGLQFFKEVRDLAHKISDLLETARGQARARKPDKDTDTALKDADDALGDLRETLSGLEQDIHTAVPTAGMRVSVAA